MKCCHFIILVLVTELGRNWLTILLGLLTVWLLGVNCQRVHLRIADGCICQLVLFPSQGVVCEAFLPSNSVLWKYCIYCPEWVESRPNSELIYNHKYI